MGYFTYENLTRAVETIKAMDEDELSELDGRCFTIQPDLFWLMQQPRVLGGSDEDQAELMDILVTVYLVMEQSGLPWPRISRTVLDQAEKRVIAAMTFAQDLPEVYPQKANTHWVDGHPEKYLMCQIAVRIGSTGYACSPGGEPYFLVALFVLVEALSMVGKTLPRLS